jgi:glycosyltransferase involved in cell wall biosynthesis
MNRKVVLYTFSWLPRVGGIETLTAALATGLTECSKMGHPGVEVVLVTESAADGMDDGQFPFRVVRRPGLLELIREIRAADIVHLANAALRPLLIAHVLGKIRVIEHDGYQVVCPNGLLIFGRERSVCPGHFMAARYHKCLHCSRSNFGSVGSLRALILTFVRRWLAQRANANIVPSRHMGIRVSLPRANLIYHGTEPVNLEAAVDSEGPVCFAFAGRLVPEKGVDVLLKAAHQLSRSTDEFRVQIVGDGPERARLERLAAELGLEARVKFVGPVPAKRVNAVLSQVSAVVIPSVWEDCAPVVALEQMMQGRLVIASDIGGLGETVDGYGLKFPAGDVDALESCMRHVIVNPKQMTELRKQARQQALYAYSEERTTKEHLRLYLELLKTGRRRAIDRKSQR